MSNVSCHAMTWRWTQCTRPSKIEKIVRTPDGRRCRIPVCVRHYTLLNKNGYLWLFEEGTLLLPEKKDRKRLIGWIEEDLPEDGQDENA